MGIDDSFIKRIRETVTPGTSAIFLLTSDGVRDRIAEEFRGSNAQLVETNLDREQEDALRGAFQDA